MELRAYTCGDCPILAELFHQTVHTVNAKDYTEAQLWAWSDGQVDLRTWDRSFLAHPTWVALEQGQIVGFGDIELDGYLNRLYVHKDWQRRGIGRALCHRLEQAVAPILVRTQASRTAQPFFLSRGYRLVRSQQVQRRGIWLPNAWMEKQVVRDPAFS